jgi:hypothetical protein
MAKQTLSATKGAGRARAAHAYRLQACGGWSGRWIVAAEVTEKAGKCCELAAPVGWGWGRGWGWVRRARCGCKGVGGGRDLT